MAAYDQLLAEGYLVSEQRRGYYVAQVEQWEMHPASAVPPPLGIADCPVPEQTEQPDDVIDLIQNRVPPDLFPLSVWNRLSRRVWREEGQALLRPARCHPGQPVRKSGHPRRGGGYSGQCRKRAALRDAADLFGTEKCVWRGGSRLSADRPSVRAKRCVCSAFAA